MKYLLLLALLTFVGFLVYLRLRPYIAFARRVFGVVRTARSLNMNEPNAPAPAPHAPAQTNEALVLCAACGTWLPTSRALVFRATKAAYCSADCIERAASGTTRKRAGGSA